MPGFDRKQLQSVEVRQNDLSDVEATAELITQLAPDAIVHLAGNAFVPDSWKSPAATLRNNTIAAVNVAEGARRAKWRGRLLFVSSSDVYGTPPAEELPLREDSALRLESPYAVSKRSAEEMLQFLRGDGLELIIARPFNHLGPGQRDDFVAPAFFRRIQQAVRQGADHIEVGELRAVRDFTDVRDVVRAYATLIERGVDGEIYNVCSGEQSAVGDLLALCLRAAGATLETRVDPALLRPEAVNARYGSAEKLERLGWRREISLEQTLRDAWQYIQTEPAE